jgi:hypothetical protein
MATGAYLRLAMGILIGAVFDIVKNRKQIEVAKARKYRPNQLEND